jgi:hypothetical protein
MNDYEKMQAEWEERRRQQREANAVNRRATFDALAALGIKNIVVTFNGCGDSGQIYDIAVSPDAISLAGRVTLDDIFSSTKECPLREAVEDMCYAYLDDDFAGWQDNDGAFGEFDIDVARRTVTLHFNARYTTHETSEHTFEEA